MLMNLALAITLIGVLAISVFGASETVYINKGDGPVQSSAISADDGAKYKGKNYETSGHKLYIDLQSSDGSGWENQKTSLMDIGTGAYGKKEISATLLWRVQLNCQYWYTDCEGKGTVSNLN